jgi:hypothetical protein
MRGEVSRLDIVDKILIDGIMTTNEQLRVTLTTERARADRLADRAVMLESRLAEVTRWLQPVVNGYGSVVGSDEAYPELLRVRGLVERALAVAEGES